MRGVSHTAVQKAVASSRITLEADGSIDPAKADRQWLANTDPAQQRKVGAFASPGAPSASPAADPSPAVKPVPAQAIKAVEETLGAPPSAADDGQQPSFVRARLANEIIKASTAKLRLAKMQGDLVDKNKATALIYELARRERDSWLNWPSRVAANMAAEIGCDPHLMQATLERFIRDQLADLAEVKLELR